MNHCELHRLRRVCGNSTLPSLLGRSIKLAGHAASGSAAPASASRWSFGLSAGAAQRRRSGWLRDTHGSRCGLSVLRILDSLSPTGSDACCSAEACRRPSLDKITFRAALAAVVSFRAGPGARAAADRLAARPLPRADQERLAPTCAGCTGTSRLRPPWADCSSWPAWSAALLLFGDLANRYVQAALLVAVGLAAVGAVDDLVKLRGRGERHLRPGQTGRPSRSWPPRRRCCSIATTPRCPAACRCACPWPASPLPLGSWFIPLAVLVIVGSSNAVNLTDGLDGLAGGCLIFATGAMAVVAYVRRPRRTGRVSARAADSRGGRTDRAGRRR